MPTVAVTNPFLFGNIVKEDTCYKNVYLRVSKGLPTRQMPKWAFQMPLWKNDLKRKLWWSRRTKKEEIFLRLWGNLIQTAASKTNWKDLPEAYRGYGCAGAAAWYWDDVSLVPGPKIWAGELKPGAVMQGWHKSKYYQQCKKGIQPSSSEGHAMVFVDYKKKNEKIIGIDVADNGYRMHRGVMLSDFPVLVGANLQ